MNQDKILEELVKEASATQLQLDSIKNVRLETLCGCSVRAANNLKRNGFVDSLKLTKWLMCDKMNREFIFFTIPGVGEKTYSIMIPMLEIYCGISFPEYIKNGLHNHIRWCRNQEEYKYDKETMRNEVQTWNSIHCK